MNISSIKNDLILFKDETLKTIREMEKQLFEKIQIKNNETESKIDNFNLKILKFQEMNKRMYQSIIEQQVNLDKLKHLNEFKTKTDTKFVSLDIKMTNIFSELVSIKSKYDKIMVESLQVPGIIGVSCKYSSISEYIIDNLHILDVYNREKDNIKKKINELELSDKKIMKDFTISINDSISECKLYTDKKINEIKNYFKERYENLDDILTNTKNRFEENVIKNEKINETIKNDIINTKNEITNLIMVKHEESEKKNDEIKKIQSEQIKKQITDIKKNFKELKVDVEKRVVEAYKLGKNKININSFISGSNNHLSNNNNGINNINNRNVFNEIENNKNNTKSVNINSNLKDKDNNSMFDLIKNDMKVNSCKENNSFKNKEDDLLRLKLVGAGRNSHLKNLENLNNAKNDFKILNSISRESNNKENKINIPKKSQDGSKDINNSKDLVNVKEKLSRNKTLSDIKSKGNLLDENNSFIDYKYKTNKKNNKSIDTNKIYYLKSKIKNLNLDIKNKSSSTKYIIKSIDSGENSSSPKIRYFSGSNLFYNKNENKINNENEINNYNNNNINNSNNNNDNDNSNNNTHKYNININLIKSKNISVKLLKDKIHKSNESSKAYLKQQSSTMHLYKEYYDKKMKEQKLKEELLNKIIKKPKKVSPVFGRTSYADFVLDKNNEKNIKNNFNGNMNINIDNEPEKFINKYNDFFIIKGSLKNICFPSSKDKTKNQNKNQNKSKKKDNDTNLSV